MSVLRKVCLALVAVGFVAVAQAAPGSADNTTQSILLSQSDGLVDGQVITVSIGGFAPGGNPAKLVIAGQGDFTTIPDKLNFEEYATAPEVVIQPDGTGVGELLVYADHGTVQDGTTLDCNTAPCWVVAVQEPFLPQPNFATQPITFASAAAAAPAPVQTPTAPTPAVTAPPTTLPVATTVPPPTVLPQTTVAPTTTAVTTTTTTTAPPREIAAAPTSATSDGPDTGLLIGVVSALAVVLALGGLMVVRPKLDA